MPLAQVVVIDDSRVFGQMARAVLHNEGFSAVIAFTVDEGIAAARDNPQALLLVDYHLGDRCAVDVLDAVDPAQPFIIITGDGESRLAVEMMKRGARDFIVKDESFVEMLPHVVGRAIEQLQRELVMQRREARLAGIFEACADALLIVATGSDGACGRIVDVNGSAARTTGRSRDALRRTDLADVFPLLSGAVLHGACGSALAGEPVTLETALRSLGGTLPVELTMQRLDNHHDTQHVLFMARDISERERAAAQHRLLATAIEQSAEAVMITDDAGCIEYANPAFERITGYSRDEVTGHTPRLLKSGVHDESFYRELWRTIGAGNTWRGHMINRRKDGSHYEQMAVISPVRDSRGQLTHFVVVARDVTRDVQVQQQLLQSQKMDAVGVLAGGIAHDFNNLLVVMQSASESLLDALPVTAPTRVDANSILQAARRARRMTGKLLAVSRGQPLQSRRVDMARLLVDGQHMLRRLMRSNIALALRTPPPGSADVVAFVDPTQIEQVVTNLVINARDAIFGAGSIDISLARTELDVAVIDTLVDPSTAEPGPCVRLRVSDDGRGMDADTLARACDPFFTTKAPSHGAGLGLATVYGIVRQHGGSLAIASEPGRGTTISVYLPAAPSSGLQARVKPDERSDGEPARDEPAHDGPAHEHRDDNARPDADGGGGGDDDDDRGAATTLLLVEDDGLVRKATARMLVSLGYDVITAENGQDALERVRQGLRPAAVISDVMMPLMGGAELALALHDLDDAPKVLLVSGFVGDDSDLVSQLPDDVVLMSKPFRRAEIARQLEQLLAR